MRFPRGRLKVEFQHKSAGTTPIEDEDDDENEDEARYEWHTNRADRAAMIVPIARKTLASEKTLVRGCRPQCFVPIKMRRLPAAQTFCLQHHAVVWIVVTHCG